MKIIKKNINSLLPAGYNPRKDLQLQDKELQQLINSIKEFGYVEPIIYNIKTGVVVGGHQRLKALKHLGYSEVDVVEVDLEEDKEKALNIALNKISGDWDNSKLADLLKELDTDGFNLELTGFSKDEIDELYSELDIDGLGSNQEQEVEEDNFEVELPEEPISKYGDIWQLGNHRLMCGDSTKAEEVAKLMDDKKADMVFTDPPYGMHLNTDFSSMKSKLFKGKTGGSEYEDVIGDNDDFKPELINTVFNNFGYCKEIFMWGADYYAELLPNKNNGSWVVWDKRSNGDMDNIVSDISSDKMYGSCFELCWSKERHKRDIARIKWAGLFGMEKEDTPKRVHPTQKPIKLSHWFLERYSKEKSIVVDIFGGSGSTLIACEQLNRTCYMMELDPKYVDVIINRWETLTGKKAERIEEGKGSETIG